jgi:transcription-repair coupling factor (superfamily II helicase)
MTGLKQMEDLHKLWAESLIHGGDPCALTGLWGASRALVLSLLEERRPHPLLVITATPSEAERFHRDLQFFLKGTSLLDDGSERLSLFPQWEILPYDDKSPHPAIVQQRLSALAAWLEGHGLMMVTTIRAVMQRLLPRKLLARGSLHLRVGETRNLERLAEEMAQAGYQPMDLVDVPGTFSRRGGILDIFPPNQEHPLRLEFFGDEIESIRLFSPEDQRSFRTLSEVSTIPSREILLDRNALSRFREDWEHRAHPMRAAAEATHLPDGVEFYAPLFGDGLETLLDYLPGDTVVVLDQPAELRKQADVFWKEVGERHELAVHQGRHPCSAEALYLSPQELQELTALLPSLAFSLVPEDGQREIPVQTQSIGGLSASGRGRIGVFAETLQTLRREAFVAVVVQTQGQAERLAEVLSADAEIPCTRLEHFPTAGGEKGQVGLMTGSLSTGFRFPLLDMVVVTEDEIFGVKRTHRPSRPMRQGPFLSSLSELKEGDLVVHVDHGIGRYRGLEEVSVEGLACDLVQLEYAGGDFLYVPPEKIHLIQKYSGTEGGASLVSRLGGTAWERLKGKVRKSIEEMSRELVELYAQRKLAEGFAFAAPDHLFREFEDTFEYEETPDQQRAISDVLADLQKPQPMDRLVCGDVGYGKTEVAMRAAFKVVLDEKQAAILVPTTLLAQQHYDSFVRRMSAFPVEVEMLSRFKTQAEQRRILARAREGGVDILIGTHRLLSRDMAFRDLGLVVIDEEQRFGVRHKEKLKQLRKEVDVLTLTATPIPRTLEMSLLGIRDISIINTPPEDRLSIYTRVARFSEGIVREAVLRELDRGGQIFFVHNRVLDIDRIAGQVHRIVPEARVAVAHGQMDERGLQEVMERFLDGEVDLLVSTSIIESGLDIPSANTMIIHRPEDFGLGQLYQLRGRIGRTHHRAYAYLLTRRDRSMTREAQLRLQVIQELTELGSGFQIAARDLEIRGAGNLLGPQQSGMIAAVGFDLYMHLVGEVARKLKGQAPLETLEPTIHMRVTARIPKRYVPEDRLRLDLYRRLAALSDVEALQKVTDEMIDRFGRPPQAVEDLLRVVELRLFCRSLRVVEVVEQTSEVRFTFDPKTPVPQERILQLIQENPERIRPVTEYQIELQKGDQSFMETWAQTRNFLQELV